MDAKLDALRHANLALKAGHLRSLLADLRSRRDAARAQVETLEERIKYKSTELTAIEEQLRG